QGPPGAGRRRPCGDLRFQRQGCGPDREGREPVFSPLPARLSPALIPRGEDVRGDTLWHRFGDLFNPPGLTNFIGCVQADTDLCAFRSLSFPPFSGSDLSTGAIFVDGVFLQATGTPIGYTWYPDRVEREADWKGLKLRTRLA